MTRKICSHCDRSFTPRTDANGPIYTDAEGKACCDVCYCDACGHGHVTVDQHIECQDEAPIEGPDPDLAREIALDGLLGV